MASQGKSQILQEMQRRLKYAGIQATSFRSRFQASPGQSYGASWPREDADCDVDNDNVHFDRLQKPITLSNR